MRLIDTSTFRLVNRHDGDIPPYAILSHTWDEEEEVSFQELRELSTEDIVQTYPQLFSKKTGYAEVRSSSRDRHPEPPTNPTGRNLGSQRSELRHSWPIPRVMSISGSTHVALIRRQVLSYPRPSIACFDGIVEQKSAMLF